MFIKTRIFSFIALASLAAGCGYIGREGYYAATDSWVAPAILGPDNDLIIENKLKLAELLDKQAQAKSELAGVSADLEAGTTAIVRLNDLKTLAGNALSFSTTTTSQQVYTGNADIKALSAQKQTINDMIARQTTIVSDAKKNLAAGLIAAPDYTKEQQTLDTLQVQLMENDRTKITSSLMLSQAALTQQSLFSHDGKAPTPEMMMSAQMLVQIECQLLTVEADMRTKTAEKNRAEEELAKIDELMNDLKARPIFRAIEKSVDVAFVSYAQIQGLEKGQNFYNCVWGLFACKKSGIVMDIIPGEAILTDPWGQPARGQFITLTVQDREAMLSKTLRVRGGGIFSNKNYADVLARK